MLVHNFPEVVSSVHEFGNFGKIVRVFPLLDTIFIWKNGILAHYQGIPFAGWRLYNLQGKSLEESERFITQWLNGLSDIQVRGL